MNMNHAICKRFTEGYWKLMRGIERLIVYFRKSHIWCKIQWKEMTDWGSCRSTRSMPTTWQTRTQPSGMLSNTSLTNWVLTSYDSEAVLVFGSKIKLSRAGFHQGHPLTGCCSPLSSSQSSTTSWLKSPPSSSQPGTSMARLPKICQTDKAL